MHNYHDSQWLDNLGRQYEIALDACSAIEDVVAWDLVRRTGAGIDRVLLALNLVDGANDSGKPWLQEVVALNEKIRSLMGDEFKRLRARIELMWDVRESCVEELAGHRDGNLSELLCSYACEHAEGEGLTAWLEKADAEDEQIRAKIDAAAELNDLDEVARLLFVDRQQVVDMLDAYRSAVQSETFASWALRRLEAADAAAE